jgi:hypothetical protein
MFVYFLSVFLDCLSLPFPTMFWPWTVCRTLSILSCKISCLFASCLRLSCLVLSLHLSSALDLPFCWKGLLLFRWKGLFSTMVSCTKPSILSPLCCCAFPFSLMLGLFLCCAPFHFWQAPFCGVPCGEFSAPWFFSFSFHVPRGHKAWYFSATFMLASK